MREKFPLALIMIDIDDFKKFNDRHGHLAGDACLRQVADIISQTVTRAGDFVARYGGEEFAVLLSNTKEDGAFFLADKIRQNIAAAFIKTPASPGSITASFGVAALVSSQKISPADLISAADRALYQAKASGKNCVARASQIKDPDDHNSKEQVDG
jgi:diguanylate cyclase (GGDEF)-like protein